MMRMIAAIDSNYGLATDDGIPWTLPTDQRFFVETTGSGLILMGYGTYVEFSAPMHHRMNYIATRRAIDLPAGFTPVADVAAFVAEHRHDRINNIGGAGLFSSTLGLADELILTRIDQDFGCTKFFPRFEDAFDLAARSEPITENGSAFRFETWRPRHES